MIPLKVILKNFLSYGPAEQTVVFEPYSLLCLSGKNGHGKSSILDAITWAIWGCARKMVGVAKGDDGLVHLGQKEMVVHLEFLVNDQKYRIRREYFKSYGKPITRLDVEVFDDSLGQFVTLTDKSVRATQEKIERIVGLDFDTFVSTSFLRQGQSNEFSKKTPRERKEVIASILGLGSYDAKAAVALEKSKEVLQKITQIKVQAEYAKNIAAVAPQVQDRMVVVQADLQRVAAELYDIQKAHLECNNSLQEMESVKSELFRFEESKKTLQRQEQQNLSAVNKGVLLWRSLHRRLIAIPSLDILIESRARVLAELDELRTRERQAHVLDQKIQATTSLLLAREVAVQHEYELKKNELLRKKDEFGVQLKYAEALLTDLASRMLTFDKQFVELSNKQKECIAQLVNREQVESAYDVSKKLFERRRSFYHACVSKRKIAESALAEIMDHKKVVSDVENPSCPLCQQLVTIKRKNYLVGQLTKQELFQRHKLNRVVLVLVQLEETLTKQRSELEREARICLSFQTIEQDLVRITGFTQELDQERARVIILKQEQQEKLAKIKNDLEKIEQELNLLENSRKKILLEDEEIKKSQKQLNDLKKERAVLVYVSEVLQEKAQQVALFDEQLKDLQQRDGLFNDAVVARHAVGSRIADIRRDRQEIIRIGELITLLSKKVGGYAAIVEKKAVLDSKISSLLLLRDEYSREQGSLIERKKQCDEADASVKHVETQIDSLMHEKKEYDILADAYGKNGIQALLIESVLPEIEQEANILLARLTDNQMQVFIESLRDLKSGGVRETLDIQISDSVGIRPYEMFSGGEAFRIDFALRIAVSRLLARRAGTHLQTLMIDEGFGSQDEEGLSRLTHALFAVQKDFEKIIVVSHLERLKENFPVHIVVEKRAGSSVVHVEERG